MTNSRQRFLLGGAIGLAVGFVAGALATFYWLGYAMRTVNARLAERERKAERVESAPQLQAPRLGPRSFDFNLVLEDSRGNRIPTASFRGQVLLVNFWSSSCKPCLREMPALARLYKLFEDDHRIAILPVSVDSRSTFEEFLRQHHLPLPVYRLVEDPTAKQPAMVLPTTLVVDRHGTIVAGETGAAKWDDPSVVRFLRGLLNAEAHSS